MDAYLKKIFSEYLTLLRSLNGTDELSLSVKGSIPIVESLALGIRNSVSEYLKGFPHAAYDKLKQAIEGLGGALKPLMIETGDTQEMRFFERLYRIRVGKLDSFSRGDLFHVPFELRHLVSSQRFSISGLPSLYLSGSLWACWEELNRPDFHTIQASRYRYQSSARLLDFGFKPHYLARLRDYSLLSPEVLTAYAVCWPLIAACSVRVSAPGKPFIPEYIVPQLLLQWVRNETDLDGLRYSSTRTQENLRPWPAMNYVFPVQKQAASGYCLKLQKKFALTAPCSWSILTSSDFVDVPMSPDDWEINLNEDRSVAYYNTDFQKCEQKLEGLACRSVDGKVQIS